MLQKCFRNKNTVDPQKSNGLILEQKIREKFGLKLE